MVVFKKENAKCKLKKAVPKSSKSKKFKYLGSVENGKHDAEIRRCIRIAKDTSQNLSNVLRKRKILLETKKIFLNYYAIPVFLHGGE